MNDIKIIKEKINWSIATKEEHKGNIVEDVNKMWHYFSRDGNNITSFSNRFKNYLNDLNKNNLYLKIKNDGLKERILEIKDKMKKRDKIESVVKMKQIGISIDEMINLKDKGLL